MQPNERITSDYDLSAIAGAAIREAEAKKVAESLDPLLEDSTKIPVNKTIDNVTREIADLIGTRVLVNSHEAVLHMSAPYDEFEQDGTVFESRVYRYSTPEPGFKQREAYGFGLASIYFLAITAEGETNPGIENLRYGFIKSDNGEQVFFEVKENPNYYKNKPVQTATQVSQDGADSIGTGDMSSYEYLVTTLDPESQYMVVEELKKAVGPAN